MKIELVEAVKPLQLGEGPHWVENEQALYLVDLLAGGFHRYEPSNQKHTNIKIDGGKSMGFAVPIYSKKGLHIVGHGRDMSVVEWDGLSTQYKIKRVLGTVESDIQMKTPTRFNDGKADPAGRIWAGTMSTEIDNGRAQPRVGSVYNLNSDGKIHQRIKDIQISNGLAWTADTFYYIDSDDRRVDAFNYDHATGNIMNRRCVFDFVPNGLQGVPDGMTIDTAGNLWVAVFDGSQVLCVDPKVGKLVTKIPLPVKQVTSAAWGGKGLDELYVTTGAIQTQVGAPKAGALFRVTGLGAKGMSAVEAKLDSVILNQL